MEKVERIPKQKIMFISKGENKVRNSLGFLLKVPLKNQRGTFLVIVSKVNNCDFQFFITFIHIITNFTCSIKKSKVRGQIVRIFKEFRNLTI